MHITPRASAQGISVLCWEQVPPDVLVWEQRSPQLLEEILKSKSDLISLQEVNRYGVRQPQDRCSLASCSESILP